MLFKQEEKSTKGRGQDGVEGKGTVCSLICLKDCHVVGGVDLFFVIPEERAGATGYKVCFDRRQESLTELSKPTSAQTTSFSLPPTT